LRRTGKKKQPHYRVVVADQRAPRDGDFVEVIGHYNPRTQPSTIVLKEERTKHWLSVGAQPSETVHRILHKAGLIETEPPKRVTKPSRAEREAAEATAAIEEPTADTASDDDIAEKTEITDNDDGDQNTTDNENSDGNS
tara:strand:- start:830 stop:1246 length:417 start_codon:yes stop_codon:yes gene_type:complete